MIETILVILFVVMPAIVLHECAHGWAAYALGDPTAKQAGRLTLNPVKHVDLVGTIIVPGVLWLVHALGWTPSQLVFGWAKPVPVNFSRLNDPKRDIIWVGLAGPLMNIALALVQARLLLSQWLPEGINKFLMWGVVMNIGLALFNMIPIPPLDGSRVVAGLIPRGWERTYMSLEPFGFIIVIVLLNTGLLNFLDPMINVIAGLMGLS